MSLPIHHPLARELSGRQTLLEGSVQMLGARGDLHVGWWDATVRDLLERVFQHGFFASNPAIGENFISSINQFVLEDRARHEIYSRLRRFVVGNRQALESIEQDSSARVERRVQQLQEFLPTRIDSLLDLGNGNGQITEAVARAYALNPETAVGVDTVARAEESPYYQQAYISPEEPLPFADNSFQVATMLMVLHHLRDPAAALAEVYRVLEPGGLLLIRESDVPTRELKNFNAIMEDFYYRVFHYYPTIPIPNLHLPAGWWVELAEQQGLQCQRVQAVEDQNPFTPVYLSFGKAH